MKKRQSEQKINIPPSAKKIEKDDIEIRVMPSEFFGRKAQEKVVPKQQKPIPPKPAPLPVAKPVPAKKPLPKKKSGLSSTMKLLFFGLVFLLILAGAGFFILWQEGKNEAIEQNQNNEIDENDQDVIVDSDEDEDEVDQIETIYPGQDTDSDGLTDREESLYGTDFRNPDTDADSFLDGNEVFHRYDPLGLAPSTLLEAGFVKEYTTDTWSLTYPKQWSISKEDTQISFSSQEETVVELDVFLADEAGRDFNAWHEERFGEAFSEQGMKTVKTKEGYTGYTVEDELTTYLFVGEDVYIFFYQINGDATINYLQTFQMMINSLMIEV